MSIRNRRGMSFPELMIASAIFMSSAVLFLMFMSQNSESWQVTSIQQGLVSDIEKAAAEVNRELRNATRTAAGTPPNATRVSATDYRFYLPGDIDGNGTILDATGNIEWTTATQIQYFYDAGTRMLLRRTLQAGVPVGADRVIASDITAAAFEDQASDATLLADEVRLTATIARTTVKNRTLTSTVNSISRLRN